MYNSGGATDSLEAIDDSSSNEMRIHGRGEGVFGAYSNSRPKFCSVNAKEAEFEFSIEHHFLTVNVPRGTSSWEIAIHY